MDNKRNKKEPILSICIPTYNRPNSFKKMIEMLMPQLDEDIEIVVRDDSSDSKTEKIFKKATENSKSKKQYFKGEKIGLDAANLFLLKKSRGSFIWWLSDDDLLLDNGIKTVLKLIKKHKNLNFIWANFAYNEISHLAVDREDGFFSDRNEVLISLGTSIGLLSTYILRREVAMSGIDYASKHVYGFSFASTSVVFWVLTLPGKSYFMRGPFILCKPTTVEEFKEMNKEKIINQVFEIYGVRFYNVVWGLRHHFDKKAIRIILRENFSSLWRGMLIAWVGGWENPVGKRWKMLKIYWSYPECWIAIILFLLPKSLNKIFYKIYKFFFFERKFLFSTINKK